MKNFKEKRIEINKMMDDKIILLNEIEAMIILNSAIATQNLKGDIVEIGTYRGGSAKLLNDEKLDRKLHLFDTWNGIEETTDEDNLSATKFFIGRYNASFDEVKQFLGEDNIFYYKGKFPDTYENNIKKISLLHLDVDLYYPTKKALEMFWDKIESNGIIILHDYPSFAGVVKAVDEFLVDKKFIKLKTWESQTIIIKL